MSVVSGIMGAKATKSAGKSAEEAQKYAADIQKEMFELTRKDFEPYRKIGVTNLPFLQKAVTGQWTPNVSPSAKYQLREGNLALMRSLGARGLAGSGLAPSKLAEMSQRVAANDYTDQYNRLLDLVKIGTGASASSGSAAANYANQTQSGANNLASIYQNMGQQKASLYSGIGQSNGQIAGSLISSYLRNRGGSGSGAAATSDRWMELGD